MAALLTRRRDFLLGSLLLVATPTIGRTASKSIDIDALISRMTLEEKAGQLTIMPAAAAYADAAAANPAVEKEKSAAQISEIRAGRIGAVFNCGDPAWYRQVQKIAVTETRLKVPLLFAGDVIHGFRTSFPVPLGESASFDADLAERTARATSIEATAAGIAWTFAPMVDVARDARWGRGVEGAGEDTLLGQRMAAARVKGFQGRNGLADRQSMAATPKHFAAYGASLGGLDYSTVDMSERTLREVYLPPFTAGFDAGAPVTMAAFHEFAGIPVHANHWMLTDVLRDSLKFDGLVVSDWEGDKELINHGLAKDGREAAKLAILAGVDMSMASGLYAQYLPDLVNSGEVAMARVDEAVRRVLKLKLALGLFEDPFNRLKPANIEKGRRPVFRQLARESARKSIVLLKNDGVLPLPKSGKRLALIGPFVSGKNDLHGPWSIFANPQDAVDVETGIRAAVAGANVISVVKGCGVNAAVAGGVDAAVAAAEAADIAILFVGEGEKMSGEAFSRTTIDLPAAQQALIEAVARTGKPYIVVLRNGRAMTIKGAAANANAIVVSWFLGTETGTALADVIFGDFGPCGRLPVSFPWESGQSPYFYDHKASGRPPRSNTPEERYTAKYLDAPTSAAFPFGHGLTYGNIEYEGINVGDGNLPWDGKLDVRARLTNSGTRAATEVAQLYIRDRTASIARPIRQLKDFKRVDLAPGETKDVVFSLSRADLLFIGQDMTWTVEPGAFEVWVGPSAETGLKAEFQLTAKS